MRSQRENKISGLETTLKYLAIIMAILYILTGIVILFNSDRFFNIPAHYQIPMGSALLLYGSFRVVRIYQRYFKK